MEELYQETIQDFLAKKSMEKSIELLESIGFRFVEFDHLNDLKMIRGLQKLPHYRFMLRFKNRFKGRDVLDYNLIFGIDLKGRSNELYIWAMGKREKHIHDWEKTNIHNFKPKQKGTRYPDNMSIQDRIDFRRIERKVPKGSATKEELEFYHFHKDSVDRVNGKV